MLIRIYLGDHVTFSMPPAGLACWLYLKEHSIIDPLTDELRNEGILIRPQADYSTGYPAYPALFIGFCRLSILQIEDEIGRAHVCTPVTHAQFVCRLSHETN